MNPVLILGLLCDLYGKVGELTKENEALKARNAELEAVDG
jgi:hypothetical protein